MAKEVCSAAQSAPITPIPIALLLNSNCLLYFLWLARGVASKSKEAAASRYYDIEDPLPEY